MIRSSNGNSDSDSCQRNPDYNSSCNSRNCCNSCNSRCNSNNCRNNNNRSHSFVSFCRSCRCMFCSWTVQWSCGWCGSMLILCNRCNCCRYSLHRSLCTPYTCFQSFLRIPFRIPCSLCCCIRRYFPHILCNLCLNSSENNLKMRIRLHKLCYGFKQH